MTLAGGVVTLQKAGMEPDENDDYGSFSSSGRIAWAAVADGATESSFSGLWAKSLALAWTTYRPTRATRAFPVLVDSARAAWREGVPPIESLPWFAQGKLAQGSHATAGFLRVIRGPRVVRWEGLFVGDAELFVVSRPDLRLHRREPLAGSHDFNYHPQLIATAEDDGGPASPIRRRGTVRPPAELLLCTDALAQMLLAEHEAGRRPWGDWLDALRDPVVLRERVDRARNDRRLRNDDVTVTWISVPS